MSDPIFNAFRNLPETEFVIVSDSHNENSIRETSSGDSGSSGSDSSSDSSGNGSCDSDSSGSVSSSSDSSSSGSDSDSDREQTQIGSPILPNGDEVITNIAIDLGTLPPEPYPPRQKFCALTYAPHLETRTIYVIVSGCFNTFQEADTFSSYLHARDPRWNRSVGETGRPLPIPIDRRIFLDNPIIRGHDVPVVPFNIISENLPHESDDSDAPNADSYDNSENSDEKSEDSDDKSDAKADLVYNAEANADANAKADLVDNAEANAEANLEANAEANLVDNLVANLVTNSEETNSEANLVANLEDNETNSEITSGKEKEQGACRQAKQGAGRKGARKRACRKEKDEEIETETETSEIYSTKCVACESNERNSLFFPCRHLVFCLDCAKRHTMDSNLCPICRTSIKEVMNIFL
jgi:hypothetical protein